jgi:hypothetical protein
MKNATTTATVTNVERKCFYQRIPCNQELRRAQREGNPPTPVPKLRMMGAKLPLMYRLRTAEHLVSAVAILYRALQPQQPLFSTFTFISLLQFSHCILHQQPISQLVALQVTFQFVRPHARPTYSIL